MFNYRKLTVIAVVLATAGSLALAGKDKENDAMSVSIAKIPLAQAVAAAEQHVNGKASRAEYEHTKLGWVYDIEVVSGSKVFDVKVDADKGNVIASTEDKADRDDNRDKRD